MDLKIIEKSRKLLIQAMGQKTFDKFIEDEKIEIKHGKGKNEIVYELDQNARVFNKTYNQSYCIEPICSDSLPIHDQLAIKYSYLKNNIKEIEKVANKRSTDVIQSYNVRDIRDENSRTFRLSSAGTGDVECHQPRYDNRPRYDNQPRYNEYVEYLELRGWSRQQLCIDEHNTNIVTLGSGNVNSSRNRAMEVYCPAGQKITIMGTNQIGTGIDVITAHALQMKLANADNVEIPPSTRTSIVKETSSEMITNIAEVVYSNVNFTRNGTLKTDREWFRFGQGLELNGQQKLCIYVSGNNVDFCSANTRLVLEADLWSHDF